MVDFFGSFFFSTLVGISLFGLGLAARLGFVKRMFIAKKKTGLISRKTVYALMPAGLFLMAIYPVFLWKGENAVNDWSSFVLLAVLFALPVLAMIWQPPWLKPDWLRWLESHYGHVLEKIFAEARKMGASQWEAQVRTQADLEQWVDSLARKRKWRRK